MAAASLASLAAAARAGDHRATAALLRIAEQGGAEADQLERALLPAAPPPAHRIGVTGVPGAGKSTLVSQLVTAFRQRGARVAVVAVDPSSPFTGGALLGDRVRMQQHAEDPGVFIRSMATRGKLGGLAQATNAVADTLAALGYDPIIIETVGVGQDELDIAAAAHTTLVVLVPTLGDEVQGLKAGLMEIGDAMVVNKADLPSSAAFVRDLRATLALRRVGGQEPPPLLATTATTGEGIAELCAWLFDRDQGRAGWMAVGEARRRRWALESEIAGAIRRHVEALLAAEPELCAQVERGEVGRHEATERLLRRIGSD